MKAATRHHLDHLASGDYIDFLQISRTYSGKFPNNNKLGEGHTAKPWLPEIEGHMSISTKPISEAHALYGDLIRAHKGDLPGEVLDGKILADWRAMKCDQTLKDTILYIGSAFPSHSGHPRCFAEVAANKKWSLEFLEAIGTKWFIWNRDDWGSKIPRFVEKQFGQSADAILLGSIREAPDESDAYVDATRRFLGRDLSSTQIEQFRSAWDELPEARRESITIALVTDRRYHEGRGYVSVDPSPSKIDLLTNPTRRPSEIKSRRRWIDQEFNVIRARLWSCFASACGEFALVCDSLGDERGQVSALLENLRLAPNVHAPGLAEQLQGLRSSLTFDRYVFSAAEENIWGPDFALLFSYVGSRGLTISRYVLFQAKLIKNDSIRIPTAQLATLLRSSWHSSFYIFWCQSIGPRCVPASLLSALMTTIRRGRTKSATPTLRWAEVDDYTDSLSALLGDRFLCAELGDDPQMPGASSAEIARRIAELYGQPRLGVFSVRAQVGEDVDGGIVIGDPIHLDEYAG